MGVASGLKRMGCDLTGLYTHLSQKLRFGKQLRTVDRRLLKKNAKYKSQKGSFDSNVELNANMKEALVASRLGSAYMYNVFRHSGSELVVPKSPLSKPVTLASLENKPRKKKRSLAEVKAEIGSVKKKSKTEVAMGVALGASPPRVLPLSAESAMEIETLNAISEMESFADWGDLTGSSPLKLDQMDGVLNSSIKEFPTLALDGELDLSNFDDLFEGDLMGDDMLPTTF
jgi:hypothetical protein